MSSIIPPTLYEVLKNVVKGDIDNFEVTIHEPNKKGEGFLAEMIFITLKHENSDQVYHLAVKQAFTDQSVRKMHPIRNVFVSEIYFYNEIWPRFNNFQRNIPSRYQFQKLARCFSVASEENSERIVFENLKYLGFEVHDKKTPLSKEHFELIMQEYGKFHAISFAYKAVHPDDYANLVKGITSGYTAFLEKDYFHNGIISSHQICSKSLLPGVDDEVIEKYKQYQERCHKLLQESLDCKTKYTAIIHGDCWSNNMMFKYDGTGKVTDVRFLDFQLTKEGSPCCDLSYCIYSGAPKEILDDLDHYLRTYHDSLSQTVLAFGCDPETLYPLQQLKKDWQRYCQVGFTMAIMIWRTKLTYDGEIKDLKDITKQSEEELRNSAYDEDTYKRVTRDLLLHLYENDFL